MALIARETGLGEMPASDREIDPNFVLPELGMDLPARPPTGKGVSPPGSFPTTLHISPDLPSPPISFPLPLLSLLCHPQNLTFVITGWFSSDCLLLVFE